MKLKKAPEWKLIAGRTYCQVCGELVEDSWRLVTGTTLTLCYCEPCVERMLAEPVQNPLDLMLKS